MQNRVDINKYINKKILKYYFQRLYKIPRSILGKGFRESLNILGEIVDLNIINVLSGRKVLDWKVPQEWVIDDAYIITPNGKKIADFKKNNLHVLNYSIPINKIVNLKELKKNIFTLPSLPNAIPYVTSYYKKNWGFCLTYNEFKKLKPGKYKVVIKSKHLNGRLVYSNSLIQGKSKKEILFWTYLCHPQMANNELSGPLVWSVLYKILKDTGPHKYSYRFIIGPENIGSAAFLHKSKSKLKNIVAGYIVNCLGYGKIFTLKKSRIGNTLSDKAAINVIVNEKKKKIIDFFPDGSDERQFCSPGFNLPISLIMRKMYGDYKEYHTSLDNEKLISYKTLMESIQKYVDLILTLERNFTPIAKIKYGTPQLSRRPINLYSDIMQFNIKKKDEKTRFILEVLNLSEGKMDLIDIANLKNFKLIDYLDTIDKLLKSNLIKKK